MFLPTFPAPTSPSDCADLCDIITQSSLDPDDRSNAQATCAQWALIAIDGKQWCITYNNVATLAYCTTFSTDYSLTGHWLPSNGSLTVYEQTGFGPLLNTTPAVHSSTVSTTASPAEVKTAVVDNGRCNPAKNTKTLPTWSHKDGSVALCAQDCLNDNGANMLPTMVTYCKLDSKTMQCDQNSQIGSLISAHTSCTHFAFVDNVCTDYSWFAHTRQSSNSEMMALSTSCNSVTAIDGKAASFKWTESGVDLNNVYFVDSKGNAVPTATPLVADNAAVLSGYCSVPTEQQGIGVPGSMACRQLAISSGDVVHYGWDMVGGVCNDYSTTYTEATCVKSQGNLTRKWVSGASNLNIRFASTTPPGPSPPSPRPSPPSPRPSSPKSKKKYVEYIVIAAVPVVLTGLLLIIDRLGKRLKNKADGDSALATAFL